VLVCACPTPPWSIPGLNATDEAVLRVLAQAHGHRLPASKVLVEMCKDGQIFAEITVKRSLARLQQLRLVKNSRKRPCGYHLAGDLPPLFRLCRE
jgi:hypothetical protein